MKYLLNYIKTGDSSLVDKGFTVQDLLIPRQATFGKGFVRAARCFGITFYYHTFIIFIRKSTRGKQKVQTLIVNNVLALFDS